MMMSLGSNPHFRSQRPFRAGRFANQHANNASSRCPTRAADDGRRRAVRALCDSRGQQQPKDEAHPAAAAAAAGYQHPELQEGEVHYFNVPASSQWQQEQQEPYAPGPGSTDDLTSGSSDTLLSSLMRNQFWDASLQPAINLLSHSGTTDIQEVHVIAFTSAVAESEGIYTLRTLNIDGLPQETVIGFQRQEEAERYACLLEASMVPHTPRITCLSAGLLRNFCAELGYRCLVERAGSLVVPPECSVESTDWERCSRLRLGQYEVLDQASYESIRGGSTF